MAAFEPSAAIVLGRSTWQGTLINASELKTTRSRIRPSSSTLLSTSASNGTGSGKLPKSSIYLMCAVRRQFSKSISWLSKCSLGVKFSTCSSQYACIEKLRLAIVVSSRAGVGARLISCFQSIGY